MGNPYEIIPWTSHWQCHWGEWLHFLAYIKGHLCSKRFQRWEQIYHQVVGNALTLELSKLELDLSLCITLAVWAQAPFCVSNFLSVKWGLLNQPQRVVMRITDDTGDSDYASGLRVIAGSGGLVFPARLWEGPQTKFWPRIQSTHLSAWGNRSPTEVLWWEPGPYFRATHSRMLFRRGIMEVSLSSRLPTRLW